MQLNSQRKKGELMRLQKISCNAAEYTCTVDTPLDEEILFLNLAYCFRHKLYKLASTVLKNDVKSPNLDIVRGGGMV